MNRLTLLCKGASVEANPFFPQAMPITGPSSYIPTTDEFLAHWALANAEPGAGGAILLQGGIGHDQLFDSRTNLSVARDAVTDAGVERALAREELDALVTRLQRRPAAPRLRPWRPTRCGRCRAARRRSRGGRAVRRSFRTTRCGAIRAMPTCRRMSRCWRRCSRPMRGSFSAISRWGRRG